MNQKAEATRHHLHRYHGLSELTFEQVDKRFLEGFRHYLQHEATTKSGTKLAKNTTSSHFNKVRAALNQAYRDGIVRNNPVQKVKSIKPENTKRTYLTLEVRLLYQRCVGAMGHAGGYYQERDFPCRTTHLCTRLFHHGLRRAAFQGFPTGLTE